MLKLLLLLPILTPCCVWVEMPCKMAPSAFPSSAASILCCRMLSWCRRAGKGASSLMSSASTRHWPGSSGTRPRAAARRCAGQKCCPAGPKVAVACSPQLPAWETGWRPAGKSSHGSCCFPDPLTLPSGREMWLQRAKITES